MGCPCNGCDGHAAYVEEQRRQMAEKRERFEQWYAENVAPTTPVEPEAEAVEVRSEAGTRYARQEDGSLKPV